MSSYKKGKPYRSSRGFSAIEVLIVIVVIAIIGAVVYVYMNRAQGTSPKTPATNTNQVAVDDKKTVIPEGWKQYSSDKHGFSIAYPDDFTSEETRVTLADDEKAESREVDDVHFVKPGVQVNIEAPLKVTVVKQKLSDAIEWRRSVAKPYTDEAFHVTITKDEKLTVAGHEAHRIDMHLAPVDKASGEPSDATYIFVQDGDVVYQIETTQVTKNPFATSDAQVMFKSFTIL